MYIILFFAIKLCNSMMVLLFLVVVFMGNLTTYVNTFLHCVCLAHLLFVIQIKRSRINYLSLLLFGVINKSISSFLIKLKRSKFKEMYQYTWANLLAPHSLSLTLKIIHTHQMIFSVFFFHLDNPKTISLYLEPKLINV